MSEKFFPFDSIQKDRVYKSSDFASYYKNFITDGLWHDNGKIGLNLFEINNLEITLDEGMAFLDGRQYINTDKLKIQGRVEDNYYRRDLIVLRLDTRLSERNIRVKVVEGIPSLTEEGAILPLITRDDNVYDLGLYSVLYRPQAIEIRKEDIKDLRGDLAYCQLSNPRGFGGSSIFRGKTEPPVDYIKAGDIWLDELEE